MKTRTILTLALLLGCLHLSAQPDYDLVIVGGNPGGIMAAIEAARMGKTSVILERTAHIGGLPANGLGATDIATRGATTGLFSEFTQRVRHYYSDTYGEESQQVKDCSDGFHFEPSVAEKVFQEMMAAEGARIKVLTLRQFNFTKKDIEMEGSHIRRIRVVNRQTGRKEYYAGRVFIDATYEGDLGAAAGVPFRIGREAAAEFNEPGAGKVYEYWKSMPAEGTTGEADEAIQAYNYRLTLTDDPQQMVPIEKPKDYRREDYVSLIEDVWTGRTTWKEVRDLQAEVYEKNRQHLKNGGERSITPWDMWGIDRLVSNNKIPNNKVDANNQHAAFISTDLPEENWQWPTASWKWRDQFAQRLRDYTMGLFWFAQHDEALPRQFREAVSKWGLAKTEYEDNGYFPRQVYVREGRRFEGMYFFTAKDALPVAEGQRPPIHVTSITASHYALDSHAAHKREEGRAHLDGFISYPTAVYTVPYGVIVPKEVDNLLLPVPVSGSHIGFSTLRMEPCWMALGQAAGAAASMAVKEQCTVQQVDVKALQEHLINEGATLFYYTDMTPADPDFKKSQQMGLQSSIVGWEAKEVMSRQDKLDWAQIGRYRADNERLKAIEDPERVVFLGNSITDFWPRRHAEFWQQHPHFVGRGISGQTSYQFVVRFREDVINLKPRTCVINVGTNDIAENTGTYNEDVTMGNIITMVEQAQMHGIRVILSSVLPAKRFSWRPAIQPEDRIASLNARIRKYAEEHHIPYADYYSALVSETDLSLREGHSNDGVHPNAKGYAVMETVILPLLEE